MNVKDANEAFAAHMMLLTAVRNADASATTRWGRVCARAGLLDLRVAASPWAVAGPRLAAMPHWYATLHGEAELLDEILPYMAQDDINSMPARSCATERQRDCSTCQLTAFQLAAVSQPAAIGCVRALLRLGASVVLPMCFAASGAGCPADELSGFSSPDSDSTPPTSPLALAARLHC